MLKLKNEGLKATKEAYRCWFDQIWLVGAEDMLMFTQLMLSWEGGVAKLLVVVSVMAASAVLAGPPPTHPAHSAPSSWKKQNKIIITKTARPHPFRFLRLFLSSGDFTLRRPSSAKHSYRVGSSSARLVLSDAESSTKHYDGDIYPYLYDCLISVQYLVTCLKFLL